MQLDIRSVCTWHLSWRHIIAEGVNNRGAHYAGCLKIHTQAWLQQNTKLLAPSRYGLPALVRRPSAYSIRAPDRHKLEQSLVSYLLSQGQGWQVAKIPSRRGATSPGKC